MREESFSELVESIGEAGAYLRGEGESAGVHFAGEPDPRAIRSRLGLTQEEFAVALSDASSMPQPRSVASVPS